MGETRDEFFRTDGLPAGDYELTLESPAGRVVTRARIPEGEAVDVPLTLTAPDP